LIQSDYNHARYVPGQKAGHYESYYLRANHPERPLAFWIRYTVFSPHGRPEDALGELWAVYFDGENQRHVAVKRELPIGECTFDRSRFEARVGDAHLGPDRLQGDARTGDDEITWQLAYGAGRDPILLLPDWAYDGRLAKAQSVVGRPLAEFDGNLTVNGTPIPMHRWIGSQNHNWGVKHTDHYAFGQVAGFDDHPDGFLEAATARLKLGPVWSPFLTMLVLRHRGREHRLNSVWRMLRASATIDGFDWRFDTDNRDVRVQGRIHAEPTAMVGLRYYNPPGGDKHCLNTKIGRCELTLTDKRTGESERLTTDRRALFELIPPTTDGAHGIPLRV